ncbi:MAG: hypothetical protein FWF77_07120 [Defluviitaleaceae bacterium]|nr:hypothetical protein [Defluviitaleaceae bacterium]
MDIEKTPYETNPVESPFEAICAFVEAFDVLQACLAEFGEERQQGTFAPLTAGIADEFRTAIFRPVRPEGGDCAPIGIYEIGVIFNPSKGNYGINRRKLHTALQKREADVRALFVQENTDDETADEPQEIGILPKLCEMLLEILGLEILSNEENEFIRAAMLRFLNECRRLHAMLA